MFGFSAYAQAPYASLGGTVFSATISESAVAADSVFSALSVAGLISEAATASDSISALRTLPGSISELVTASDAVSALRTLPGAISESAVASETQVSPNPRPQPTAAWGT